MRFEARMVADLGTEYYVLSVDGKHKVHRYMARKKAQTEAYKAWEENHRDCYAEIGDTCAILGDICRPYVCPRTQNGVTK